MTYPPEQPETPGLETSPGLEIPPGMVPPKKSKTGLIAVVVAAVLVVAGGIWILLPSAQTGIPVAAAPVTTTSTRAPVTTTTTATAPVSCVYTPTPDQPAAKNVGTPGDAVKVPTSGRVQVTLTTNLGDIPITLDRAGAPCAVHNFLFLIRQKYYDGVPCHRGTRATVST